MKKRILAITLAAALICLLMAGCGSSTTTTQSTSTTTASDSTTTTAPEATQAAEPAATTEPAADALELTMSIGNGMGSDNYYKYSAFCDKVAELSGGSLIITLYPGGTLASDNEALTAVMNGDVDFCHLTAGAALTAIKDVAPLEIPGAFRYESTDDVTSFIDFESYLHDQMDSIFADYGIKYIAFNASSQAVIVCNSKQIVTPADVSGLTFRTSGTWLGKMLEDWGAATVTMSIGDLATGLERNTVSGTLTAYGACLSNKLYEVAPYVTMMNEVNGISSLVMNMDVWNSLNAEQQGWLEEAAQYYLEFGQEYMSDYYAKAVAQMEDEGANVYTLSAEEEDAFLECVDDLYDQMEETCTDKGVTLIQMIKDWNAEH